MKQVRKSILAGKNLTNNIEKEHAEGLYKQYQFVASHSNQENKNIFHVKKQRCRIEMSNVERRNAKLI